jgi:hypothetical protein
MELQTIQSVDDEIPVYNLEYVKQVPLPERMRRISSPSTV